MVYAWVYKICKLRVKVKQINFIYPERQAAQQQVPVHVQNQMHHAIPTENNQQNQNLNQAHAQQNNIQNGNRNGDGNGNSFLIYIYIYCNGVKFKRV